MLTNRQIKRIATKIWISSVGLSLWFFFATNSIYWWSSPVNLYWLGVTETVGTCAQYLFANGGRSLTFMHDGYEEYPEYPREWDVC